MPLVAGDEYWDYDCPGEEYQLNVVVVLENGGRQVLRTIPLVVGDYLWSDLAMICAEHNAAVHPGKADWEWERQHAAAAQLADSQRFREATGGSNG